MEITIVGSGNVAEALAGAVAACDGLHLQQVCARNSRRGRTLAERYGADYTEHPQEAAPADLYLIAVSDSAVEEVSALLHPPFGATVAHTSGGLGIDALRCDTPHRAVCYPLQTFSRGRSLDLSTVPLFIEYATERAETTVRTFAETLSCRVFGGLRMQLFQPPLRPRGQAAGEGGTRFRHPRSAGTGNGGQSRDDGYSRRSPDRSCGPGRRRHHATPRGHPRRGERRTIQRNI